MGGPSTRQCRTSVTPHIPENFLVDWNLVITRGMVPPRDPKDDDDEDEDDDEEEHEDEELPVIRESDEDE
jgi:hypothetical protein